MESVTVYEDRHFDPLKHVAKHVPAFEDAEGAVMLTDLSSVVEKFRQWKELMPRIHPFYALKCNRDPLVLKMMLKLGAGFDCASREEVKYILDLGANPDRIIYANTVKFVPFLKYAKEKTVDLMTFDRASELDKIKKFYREARLLLRINIVPKVPVLGNGAKFGCNVKTEACDLLEMAKELKLNIIGVAFHIGSFGTTPEMYSDAIQTSKLLFIYGQNIGFNMNILDIGGGFPSGLSHDLLPPFAKSINVALDLHFQDPKYIFMSEPGKYFTGASGTLFTTVQSTRFVDEGSSLKADYYINDGIFNSLRYWTETNDPFFVLKKDHQHFEDDEQTHLSCIYPSCYSNDIAIEDIQLPKLDMGDFVYIRNTGKYSICLNSTFNGFSGATLKHFIHKDDFNLLI